MLKRFNDGMARGEAALALSMLLLMLVVAFAQALLRNLTNLGVGWANAGLSWLSFADFIISKGTLWLAFLGASLAVHGDKHISIDIVPRLVSPRARVVMRGVAGIIGSIICFFLARAFWSAVLINGSELPAEFAVLADGGNVHVCDATPAILAGAEVEVPGPFCAVRAVFAALSVKLETPGAAFQLISPVMFVFMSVRFLGQGIHELLRASRGDVDDDPSAHGIMGAAAEVEAHSSVRPEDVARDAGEEPKR
ncbi:MAG: TRAP transporter small permease subunit [Polyangiales bacterium]